MFALPILPDEMRVPLDRYISGDTVICEYPGVTAVVRPLDLVEQSKWTDAFPDPNAERSLAATTLALNHLLGLEGLKMQGPNGELVPYDPANHTHRRSIRMDMRSALFLALRGRASVSGVLEKNSDSPSDSDGTNDTATSPVDSAATVSETH